MVILSPDEILDFKKLGFIVLRQYYSGNEILKILDEVNRLESLMPEKGGMMKYYDTPFGQDSNNQSMILIRIEKFIETSPYLESIVNNSSVHFLLNQLFGESAVLLKEKIKIIMQKKRLATGKESLGIKSKEAPCATVKQRAKTPKGPINASAKNEKIKVPFAPNRRKKFGRLPL